LELKKLNTLIFGALKILIFEKIFNFQSTLYTFEEHLAGVKAIEYVPFQCFPTTHVATGGGRNDHRVCIWDLATGNLVTTLDTGGQITGLAFSREHREMATALGVPHMLKLWKYSSKLERFDPCIDLEGHTDRLVGLTQSPCGQFVMSAGADETLRLWHCFKVDESMKDKNNSRKFGSQLHNLVVR
jgi:cell division cycle 20, cofactor of APC complex